MPPGQSELTPTQAEGLFDLASVSAAERESQPTPGELQRSFPHFEILEMLGRGGMGVVYKARQITLDRFVAIKLLPPALGDDPDFAHRFQREARAMARLSHPGIITLHDFGQTPEGQLYFVMEFVDGANLHDLIKSGGLAPADALSIAAQVCEALAYAHGEGVVHRDIKPANVMVTHCGRVKVADFGLARLIDQENPSELTMTGTVMGTLHYMAPEQRRGEHVDHRADIFALGVMLYEMLCREVPHGMFDLPSTRVGCDPRIDHIVARAMQNEFERRFQSTQEMHAAIESARTAILVPVPVAPRVPALVPPKPPAFAKPIAPLVLPPAARSRARANAMLAVALIALAGGTWWLVHARSRAHLPPNRPDVTGFEEAAARARAVERLRQARAVTPATASKDAPFVNSLGMKFVPVPITGGPTSGQRVLFSIWETWVQDYDTFAKELNLEWNPWGGAINPLHPATMLSWNEANEFCAWLTDRERKAGRLGPDLAYRLPTDHEWSCAAGIGDKENPGPPSQAGKEKLPGIYPWGTTWPPPARAGNLADETYHRSRDGTDTGKDNPFVAGYDDGFANLAPVGSFPANTLGLYDVEGNVSEWCEGWSEGTHEMRFVCGSNWRDARPDHVASAWRNRAPPGHRSFSVGFRVVLAPAAQQADAPSAKTAWHPPPGPPGLVKTFDFSNIGSFALVQRDRRLLLLDKAQWLRLVDLASGQTLWHAAVAGDRLAVTSDDLRAVCSGVCDGTTLRADSIDAEGKTVAQWSTPYPRSASGDTLSTATSPDRKLLCLAIQERRVQHGVRTAVVVHVLATETLKSVAEWQVRPVSTIYSVVWLDTHRFLLSAADDRDLLAFDLARPADPPRPHPAQLYFTVGADPSGQFIAGSYAGMQLAITSVRDGFKPMKLREKGISRVLRFVGTRQLIALDMNCHDLSLFDVQSGMLTREFHFEDYMDKLAVSRDGAFAVMSGYKEGESNRSYAALWRLREIR